MDGFEGCDDSVRAIGFHEGGDGVLKKRSGDGIIQVRGGCECCLDEHGDGIGRDVLGFGELCDGFRDEGGIFPGEGEDTVEGVV